MPHTATALAEELAAAFAHREALPTDRIGRDDTNADEAVEAAAWLGGKTWREVRAEGFEPDHFQLLAFLSPEAFLAYLPAFASAGFDLDRGIDLVESVTATLALSPDRLLDLATPAERLVVARLLAFWIEQFESRGWDHDLLRHALVEHWSPDAGSGGAAREVPRHSPESLRAEIQESFGGRERPERLAGDRAREASSLGPTVEDWLGSATWRELLERGVEPQESHLIQLLAPEAWLYFFPALASLALDPALDTPLLSTLVLQPALFPHELLPLVSAAEHRALVHFLEFCAASSELDLAGFALATEWAEPPGDR